MGKSHDDSVVTLLLSLDPLFWMAGCPPKKVRVAGQGRRAQYKVAIRCLMEADDVSTITGLHGSEVVDYHVVASFRDEERRTEGSEKRLGHSVYLLRN